MSERGDTIHFVNFANKNKNSIFSFDYTGGDEDGLCPKVESKDIITVQRCYFYNNKMNYFGEILKLKISQNKVSVMNPNVFSTFTNWDKTSKPKFK